MSQNPVLNWDPKNAKMKTSDREKVNEILTKTANNPSVLGLKNAGKLNEATFKALNGIQGAGFIFTLNGVPQMALSGTTPSPSHSPDSDVMSQEYEMVDAEEEEGEGEKEEDKRERSTSLIFFPETPELLKRPSLIPSASPRKEKSHPPARSPSVIKSSTPAPQFSKIISQNQRSPVERTASTPNAQLASVSDGSDSDETSDEQDVPKKIQRRDTSDDDPYPMADYDGNRVVFGVSPSGQVRPLETPPKSPVKEANFNKQKSPSPLPRVFSAPPSPRQREASPLRKGLNPAPPKAALPKRTLDLNLLLKSPDRPAYFYKGNTDNNRLHAPPIGEGIWEVPERTQQLHDHLKEAEIWNRCNSPGFYGIAAASVPELLEVHSENYINDLITMSKGKLDPAFRDQAKQLLDRYNQQKGMFFTDHTYEAACEAAGCALQMAIYLAYGGCTHGFANIRPPGSMAYAEGTEGGFCIFNNVALAARCYQRTVLEKNAGETEEERKRKRNLLVGGGNGGGEDDDDDDDEEEVNWEAFQTQNALKTTSSPEKIQSPVAAFPLAVAPESIYTSPSPSPRRSPTPEEQEVLFDYSVGSVNKLPPLSGKTRKPKVVIVSFGGTYAVGTGRIFYEDPSVYTISVHKVPKKINPLDEAAPGNIGLYTGEGTNLNIGFTSAANDVDYCFAFERVVIPVIKTFNPDVILVSANFNTSFRGLQNFSLTKAGISQITYKLSRLGKRIGVCLEAGSKDFMCPGAEAMIKVLLGDAPEKLEPEEVSYTAIEDVHKSFKIGVKGYYRQYGDDIVSSTKKAAEEFYRTLQINKLLKEEYDYDEDRRLLNQLALLGL